MQKGGVASTLVHVIYFARINLDIQYVHTAYVDKVRACRVLKFLGKEHIVLPVHVAVAVVCRPDQLMESVETLEARVRQVLKVAIAKTRCMCKEDVYRPAIIGSRHLFSGPALKVLRLFNKSK